MVGEFLVIHPDGQNSDSLVRLITNQNREYIISHIVKGDIMSIITMCMIVVFTVENCISIIEYLKR